MEAYPDTLPATRKNMQFPMGDVGLSHKVSAIDQWIEQKGAFDAHQLGRYLGNHSRPKDTEKTSIRKNHAAAIELCRQWDEDQDELKLAVIGFAVIRTFTNEVSSILPAFDRDMTDVLMEMRTKHPIDARTFGKFAWAGMQFSHPAVASQLEKIITMFEGRFGLYDDERKERFLAGLTLPYVMAAHARMERDFEKAKVTGIREGTTEELEAMEFSQIFTSDN
jgi:hypothetical protein